MPKIECKGISPDDANVNFNKSEQPLPDSFQVTVNIGLVEDPNGGQEGFKMFLCTNEWLHNPANEETTGQLEGLNMRPYIIPDTGFNIGQLQQVIDQACENCNTTLPWEATANQIANTLGALWENADC